MKESSIPQPPSQISPQPQYNANQVRSIQSDIIYFKEDVLKDIKKMDIRLTSKFDISSKEVQDKLAAYDSKFEALTQKITDLASLISQDKAIQEKIEKLQNFKSNAESQLTTHEVKQNTLQKELSDAIFKYDKVIYDNIMYPGVIGNCCRFKTFRDYIDYDLTQIGNLLSFKEKQTNDLKTYKAKLDVMMQSFQQQINGITLTMTQYTNKSVADGEERMRSLLKIYEDRLEDMRVENGKYAVQLKNQSAAMTSEWGKVLDVKKEIYEKFDADDKAMKDSTSLLVRNYEGYKKEFKVIKNRFTQLSEFIKDVRFRINLGNSVKRKEYNDMSKNINFDKKQVLKEDDEHKKKHASVVESFIKKYIHGEMDINDVFQKGPRASMSSDKKSGSKPISKQNSIKPQDPSSQYPSSNNLRYSFAYSSHKSVDSFISEEKDVVGEIPSARRKPFQSMHASRKQFLEEGENNSQMYKHSSGNESEPEIHQEIINEEENETNLLSNGNGTKEENLLSLEHTNTNEILSGDNVKQESPKPIPNTKEESAQNKNLVDKSHPVHQAENNHAEPIQQASNEKPLVENSQIKRGVSETNVNEHKPILSDRVAESTKHIQNITKTDRNFYSITKKGKSRTVEVNYKENQGDPYELRDSHAPIQIVKVRFPQDDLGEAPRRAIIESKSMPKIKEGKDKMLVSSDMIQNSNISASGAQEPENTNGSNTSTRNIPFSNSHMAQSKSYSIFPTLKSSNLQQNKISRSGNHSYEQNMNLYPKIVNQQKPDMSKNKMMRPILNKNNSMPHQNGLKGCFYSTRVQNQTFYRKTPEDRPKFQSSSSTANKLDEYVYNIQKNLPNGFIEEFDKNTFGSEQMIRKANVVHINGSDLGNKSERFGTNNFNSTSKGGKKKQNSTNLNQKIYAKEVSNNYYYNMMVNEDKEVHYSPLSKILTNLPKTVPNSNDNVLLSNPENYYVREDLYE